MENLRPAVIAQLEASAYAAAAAHLRGSFRDTSLVLHDAFDGVDPCDVVTAIIEVCLDELGKVAKESDCTPRALTTMLLSASRSLSGADTSGVGAVTNTIAALSSQLKGAGDASMRLVSEVKKPGDVEMVVASGIATLAEVLELRAKLTHASAITLAQDEALVKVARGSRATGGDMIEGCS